MGAIFQIKIFILQSKAKLDEKTLFGTTSHHPETEIRKMLVRGIFVNKNATFHSGP